MADKITPKMEHEGDKKENNILKEKPKKLVRTSGNNLLVKKYSIVFDVWKT